MDSRTAGCSAAAGTPRTTVTALSPPRQPLMRHIDAGYSRDILSIHKTRSSCDFPSLILVFGSVFPLPVPVLPQTQTWMKRQHHRSARS